MAAMLVPGLERRLKAEISGEVGFDPFTRGRYATDASHYQMMPLGVVLPRTMAEAERAIAIARQEGVSVLPRGGGTSQSGQTVNHSLVVDCSKYLNRVLELDERCRHRPGAGVNDLDLDLPEFLFTVWLNCVGVISREHDVEIDNASSNDVVQL